MRGELIASLMAVKSGGGAPKTAHGDDFLCIAGVILLGFGWGRKSL
jgi:hypothetical protein